LGSPRIDIKQDGRRGNAWPWLSLQSLSLVR
jgi:hypothetical protein